MESCAYPWMASLSDVRYIYLRGRGQHVWPPPGTYVLPVGHPEAWGLVCGELEELPVGEWYWCTLDEFVLNMPTLAVSIIARVSAFFTGPLASLVSVLGHWPVVYKVGRGNADMDWLRVTFRGTLGSIEQFQHKFDFRTMGSGGYPGTDASALDLASDFRDMWGVALAFADGVSGGSLIAKLAGTVTYTEVGVVQQTQSAAGGQPTQYQATAWSPWAAGFRPSGGSIQPLPNEVATAVTLQSDTRGARGRGRTYLPPFGVGSMANDGTYADAAVAAAGRCISSFLDQVHGDGRYEPVVVSLAGGATHAITTASIGKVPDSQRRRRRSQVEAAALVWSA